jgi:hypothetical protein
MYEERRAASWNELNDALFDNTWNPSIRRHRSTFAYRGVAVDSYPLTNGLSRLGPYYPTLEQNLIKQFKKYAHADIVERDTEWHWLSVAQHHGLPTRLIDWTYSPFIALHFATCELDKYDQDAAVWKVNFSEAHTLLQDGYTEILRRLGARIFSVDALAESIKTLAELDRLHAPNFDAAIFFEPPAIDERIVNQFAYFSVLSHPTLSMSDWLVRDSTSAAVSTTKVVIDKSLKWEVRDKLDQCNMTERVLFPGLDGVCAWLKRHYKPR